MHPIGQILNLDSCPEFQGRGTERFHSPIHVIGALKIDEDNDKKHLYKGTRILIKQLYVSKKNC